MAAPIPILYEDDEIDDNFFDTSSTVSVFSTNNRNIGLNDVIKKTRDEGILKLAILYRLPLNIGTVFFKTIFSYIEFPEESVKRISISSFSQLDHSSIEYSPSKIKKKNNVMETSDYQSDVEFIDDECF
uniref:Uncharacterized protein n=1 Tax=Parastrongyloides trichosuri TaxID=131310 RepID=A0A0N4ZKE6_PARTI